MLDVTVVQRGNSLALSLPSTAGFKKGDSWLLIPDDNGGYTMVPKLKNPFIGAKPHSLYQPEEWPEFDYREVE